MTKTHHVHAPGKQSQNPDKVHQIAHGFFPQTLERDRSLTLHYATRITRYNKVHGSRMFTHTRQESEAQHSYIGVRFTCATPMNRHSIQEYFEQPGQSFSDLLRSRSINCIPIAFNKLTPTQVLITFTERRQNYFSTMPKNQTNLIATKKQFTQHNSSAWITQSPGTQRRIRAVSDSTTAIATCEPANSLTAERNHTHVHVMSATT